MKAGLVTVVIPIYKTEKYLDRCIGSVVNQSYQNLEILLIDDGSPDRCPQMCDTWAARDKRIRVIHKENGGLGMARNTGIENASGEYICFFDSDDFVAQDTIEQAYALAHKYQAEIVQFGMNSVDVNGNIIRTLIPDTDQSCISGNMLCETFLPDLIDDRHSAAKNKNLCLSACSCLFSMELVKRANWQFVSERELISEDSYSIIWLYNYVKRVAILPQALYFYCENEASLTHVYRQDRYNKGKQFYLECKNMANQKGYCKKVLISISGLYLSLVIASMKQTVAAKLDFVNIMEVLISILNDDILQNALNDIRCRHYPLSRRILFFAMRSKQYILTYLLLNAQNYFNKIIRLHIRKT